MNKLFYIEYTQVEAFLAGPLGFTSEYVTHHNLYVPDKKLAVDITCLVTKDDLLRSLPKFKNRWAPVLSGRETRFYDQHLSGELQTLADADVKSPRPPVSETSSLMDFNYQVYEGEKYQPVIDSMIALKKARWNIFFRETRRRKVVGELEKALEASGLKN